MPIRNGGSIEPSVSRLNGATESSLCCTFSVYPAQVPSRPLLTFSHWDLLKLGLGNLRSPRAPVDVPNSKSQADCRRSLGPCGSSGASDASVKSQAGSLYPVLPTNCSRVSSPGQ